MATAGTLKQRLQAVAGRDLEALLVAEVQYGDSWKRRGGVGAFMMLARKWDRLENAIRPLMVNGAEAVPQQANISPRVGRVVAAWDVLTATEADTRPEGLIDDIRDLRRYLLLVEAELVARGTLPGTLAKDGG